MRWILIALGFLVLCLSGCGPAGIGMNPEEWVHITDHDKLKAEAASTEAFWYTMMIIFGAMGIPAGIAVAWQLSKTIGTVMIVFAASSVVTGYFLREYSCWIPAAGGVMLVVAGFLYHKKWKADKEEAEAKAADLETSARELVATTAHIQEHGWTEESEVDIKDMVSKKTQEFVAMIRKQDKIDKVKHAATKPVVVEVENVPVENGVTNPIPETENASSSNVG